MARITPTSSSHSTFLQSHTNGLIVPIPRHMQNAVGKRLTQNQKNGEVFESTMSVRLPAEKPQRVERTASEVDSELDNSIEDGLDDEVQSEEKIEEAQVVKQGVKQTARKPVAKAPAKKTAARKTTGRRSTQKLDDLV